MDRKLLIIENNDSHLHKLLRLLQMAFQIPGKSTILKSVTTIIYPNQNLSATLPLVYLNWKFVKKKKLINLKF